MKVKELKRGDFFTVRPIEYPKESQVYVRGDYNHSTKRYECNKFSDICDFREFKGDKEVYTDFVF